jgi:hypothetical protein
VSRAVRQHYLPQFLQRRFGCDPASLKTKIIRLDLESGAFRKASPINEAVRRHYYRLEDETGNVEDGVDDVLSTIESRAAQAIREIVAQPRRIPDPERLVGLAQFVATLLHRTPDARADAAVLDAEIAKLGAVRLFSDDDAIRRGMPTGASNEEVAAMQQKLIADLREGRLVFESTPTREVGFMLGALLIVTEWLISKASWTVLEAPGDRGFVLSDTPVAQYDPTPKTPGAGAGFESSPNAMTVVPVDPRVALLIQPARDGLLDWRSRRVRARDVDDINLLIYAQADAAIYGPSRAALAFVRRIAEQEPHRVEAYRRQRARIWVTEIGPQHVVGDGSPRTFRGTNRDGVIERQFIVEPGAEQDSFRNAR